MDLFLLQWNGFIGKSVYYLENIKGCKKEFTELGRGLEIVMRRIISAFKSKASK